MFDTPSHTPALLNTRLLQRSQALPQWNNEEERSDILAPNDRVNDQFRKLHLKHKIISFSFKSHILYSSPSLRLVRDANEMGMRYCSANYIPRSQGTELTLLSAEGQGRSIFKLKKEILVWAKHYSRKRVRKCRVKLLARLLNWQNAILSSAWQHKTFSSGLMIWRCWRHKGKKNPVTNFKPYSLALIMKPVANKED